MDKSDIKIFRDPVLMKKSRAVESNEFGSELDSLLTQMGQVLFESSGVGLAAPQIGVSLRCIVVDINYLKNIQPYGQSYVKFVNPEIISESTDFSKATEGCLSFPGLEVMVERANTITLKYQDPYGKEYTEEFTDWAARAILHEIDHLDGVTLYTRAPIYLKNKYAKKMKVKK